MIQMRRQQAELFVDGAGNIVRSMCEHKLKGIVSVMLREQSGFCVMHWRLAFANISPALYVHLSSSVKHSQEILKHIC